MKILKFKRKAKIGHSASQEKLKKAVSGKFKPIRKPKTAQAIFYTKSKKYPNIHVVGITHGSSFRPSGKTVYPFLLKKFKNLGENSQLLVESNRPQFIPRNLANQATKIDSPQYNLEFW